MQVDTSGSDRPNDDREPDQENGSTEQGYEGAGVQEGGGYQRSADGGGGYEQSGTEDEDYDPRREGEDFLRRIRAGLL